MYNRITSASSAFQKLS